MFSGFAGAAAEGSPGAAPAMATPSVDAEAAETTHLAHPALSSGDERTAATLYATLLPGAQGLSEQLSVHDVAPLAAVPTFRKSPVGPLSERRIRYSVRSPSPLRFQLTTGLEAISTFTPVGTRGAILTV
jgi:hypothetical protein